MSTKTHIYLTLKGRILMDFWLDKTSDRGVSFGPSSLGSDIHLTVWGNQGKIRYHIRHKGIKEPLDESPVGRQTSIRLVGSKVEEMLRKRLTNYRGNRTCWAFTQERWRRIQSLLPKADVKGHIYIPLELIFSQLDMDFSKKKLWRKFRIRSLMTTEPYFGFIETKHGLRLIKPISKNQMLAWPLSKTDEVQKYFLGVLGFDDFIEYLGNTPEVKKFWSQAKDCIKHLSGS